MKIPKTISLCDVTRPIADDMPNFSQFVRIALRAYAAGNDHREAKQRTARWAYVANKLLDYMVEELNMGVEHAYDLRQQFLAEAKEIQFLDVD
jgi:hypothetical protein